MTIKVTNSYIYVCVKIRQKLIEIVTVMSTQETEIRENNREFEGDKGLFYIGGRD